MQVALDCCIRHSNGAHTCLDPLQLALLVSVYPQLASCICYAMHMSCNTFNSLNFWIRVLYAWWSLWQAKHCIELWILDQEVTLLMCLIVQRNYHSTIDLWHILGFPSAEKLNVMTSTNCSLWSYSNINVLLFAVNIFCDVCGHHFTVKCPPCITCDITVSHTMWQMHDIVSSLMTAMCWQSCFHSCYCCVVVSSPITWPHSMANTDNRICFCDFHHTIIHISLRSG